MVLMPPKALEGLGGTGLLGLAARRVSPGGAGLAGPPPRHLLAAEGGLVQRVLVLVGSPIGAIVRVGAESAAAGRDVIGFCNLDSSGSSS